METPFRLGRFIFTAVLTGLFLNFFGYPALIKYLEKSVLIKVSTISAAESGIQRPAITFCPMTPSLSLFSGWKNSIGEWHNVLKLNCGHYNDSRSILDCVEKKTFQLNETLLENSALGMLEDRKLLSNDSSWTRFLTNIPYGNCFTLEHPMNLTANFERSSIWLHFNENLIYNVYFHDPNFFLLTNNLKVIPQSKVRKEKEFGRKRQFDIYPLVVTEHRNINRPKAPCEEKTDYNFMSCITEKLVADVGCRYPWDMKMDNQRGTPICQTIEKMSALEEKFTEIGVIEQKYVIAKTGCLVPCRYRKYKIYSELYKSLYNGFGVGVTYPSTDIKLEEEEYIYPELSFISELGGALGMFLGFSFLMFWDLIIVLLTALRPLF